MPHGGCPVGNFTTACSFSIKLRPGIQCHMPLDTGELLLSFSQGLPKTKLSLYQINIHIKGVTRVEPAAVEDKGGEESQPQLPRHNLKAGHYYAGNCLFFCQQTSKARHLLPKPKGCRLVGLNL